MPIAPKPNDGGLEPIDETGDIDIEYGETGDGIHDTVVLGDE